MTHYLLPATPTTGRCFCCNRGFCLRPDPPLRPAGRDLPQRTGAKGVMTESTIAKKTERHSALAGAFTHTQERKCYVEPIASFARNECCRVANVGHTGRCTRSAEPDPIFAAIAAHSREAFLLVLKAIMVHALWNLAHLNKRRPMMPRPKPVTPYMRLNWH